MKHLHMFGAITLFLVIGCFTTFAQELHTESNAGSIANESNSLEGWTPTGSSSALSLELALIAIQQQKEIKNLKTALAELQK